MKRAQLQKFAQETNMKIIFGLNGLIGRKQTGPTDWSGTGLNLIDKIGWRKVSSGQAD